jgi:hypothetical protein
MLKGLSITPPTVGRISIGRVVERNGKRLPQKDDQFTITSQVQMGDGWVLHPLDEKLRKDAGGKLREIPVRVLFNDPGLNLRAAFSLFDRETGRPVCVGNGETCRRSTQVGTEVLPCPGPDACAFANGACKPYARFNVVIGDDDALGSFVLRTTSYNTIRTLMARMEYFRALSGNLLACMPLDLKLRGKSTTMSFHTPIYYVDLVVRSGMTLEDAIAEAKALDAKRKEAGFDQQALDEAARKGFANGAFEELEEDVPAVVEEFFPDAGKPDGNHAASPESTSSLRDRLDAKVQSAANG